MVFKEERPLDLYLIPHGTLSGGLRYLTNQYINDIDVYSYTIKRFQQEALAKVGFQLKLNSRTFLKSNLGLTNKVVKK